ncbi:MAG TPA: hypothetical protein VGN14_00655 [Candidatus Elarobacter sp.]
MLGILGAYFIVGMVLVDQFILEDKSGASGRGIVDAYFRFGLPAVIMLTVVTLAIYLALRRRPSGT